VSIDDVITVLPEVVVTATACLILLADAVVDRAIARIWMPILAVLGLLVAIFSGPLTVASHTAFGGFVVVDTFTTFFRALFCILAIFAVVVAPEYLERRAIPAAEFYATILFSTVGAMTIALASDLITVFIGLELMTIPIYVLAGMARRDRFSNEAALKYFLLGAFSSAMLLYGFAWLYGLSGTTTFAGIAEAIAVATSGGPPLVGVAQRASPSTVCVCIRRRSPRVSGPGFWRI
jgi:NADH-quinone oxidoreductase subunit N